MAKKNCCFPEIICPLGEKGCSLLPKEEQKIINSACSKAFQKYPDIFLKEYFYKKCSLQYQKTLPCNKCEAKYKKCAVAQKWLLNFK